MMIRHVLHAAAFGAALALTGCIGSDSPQDTLAAIQELQAKKFEMTESQKTEVADLVTKGKAALKAGKAKEASESLDEALGILKKAQDAAVFNKAD